MPLIQIAMTPGRSVEEKQDLIASITRETVRSLGCKETSVQILITEIIADHWGSAGKTLSEKQREAAVVGA